MKAQLPHDHDVMHEHDGTAAAPRGRDWPHTAGRIRDRGLPSASSAFVGWLERRPHRRQWLRQGQLDDHATWPAGPLVELAHTRKTVIQDGKCVEAAPAAGVAATAPRGPECTGRVALEHACRAIGCRRARRRVFSHRMLSAFATKSGGSCEACPMSHRRLIWFLFPLVPPNYFWVVRWGKQWRASR